MRQQFDQQSSIAWISYNFLNEGIPKTWIADKVLLLTIYLPWVVDLVVASCGSFLCLIRPITQLRPCSSALLNMSQVIIYLLGLGSKHILRDLWVCQIEFHPQLTNIECSFIRISLQTPIMHQKLTKHTKFYVQQNPTLNQKSSWNEG